MTLLSLSLHSIKSLFFDWYYIQSCVEISLRWVTWLICQRGAVSPFKSLPGICGQSHLNCSLTTYYLQPCSHFVLGKWWRFGDAASSGWAGEFFKFPESLDKVHKSCFCFQLPPLCPNREREIMIVSFALSWKFSLQKAILDKLELGNNCKSIW